MLRFINDIILLLKPISGRQMKINFLIPNLIGRELAEFIQAVFLFPFLWLVVRIKVVFISIRNHTIYIYMNDTFKP